MAAGALVVGAFGGHIVWLSGRLGQRAGRTHPCDRRVDIATVHIGTALGCAIRATGANANMSRAQGINVDFNKVLGLMISNGLVALASALYCQYQGFADVNAGRGAIVIGLAAVIIGEVVFSRIFRNFALKLLGVSLGAVIYYIVIQFVLTAGLNTNDLKLITALVVAIFLAIPYWKGKYFHASVKSGKEER